MEFYRSRFQYSNAFLMPAPASGVATVHYVAGRLSGIRIPQHGGSYSQLPSLLLANGLVQVCSWRRWKLVAGGGLEPPTFAL